MVANNYDIPPMPSYMRGEIKRNKKENTMSLMTNQVENTFDKLSRVLRVQLSRGDRPTEGVVYRNGGVDLTGDGVIVTGIGGEGFDPDEHYIGEFKIQYNDDGIKILFQEPVDMNKITYGTY